MHRMVWVAAALVGGMALGDEPGRGELLRQLEASDLLAQTLEQQGQTARGAATAPSGMSYDRLLRGVLERVPEASAPADLAELNDYQLRTAVAVVHQSNLEAYVENVRGGLTMKDVEPVLAGATTRPVRSQVLQRYLSGTSQPMVERPGTGGMGVNSIADGEEPAGRAGGTGDSAVTAVLAGNAVEGELGVPSTISPADMRVRGTQAIENINPRTLPMRGDAAEALAMRADPAGNPKGVRPSREEVSRVMGALGVDPDTAERLITGRTTLAEVRAKGTSPEQAESIGGLVVNDPRWSAFYYGPRVWLRDWQVDAQGQFEFSSGGGTYERADRRVNQDFDMRTRGDIDRRVNVSNDRRTNTRVDPRVNY